jgi:hypothetical protein
MSIADIIAAFLGFGLLHLRGHLGHAGWRWLFLVEVSGVSMRAYCNFCTDFVNRVFLP